MASSLFGQDQNRNMNRNYSLIDMLRNPEQAAAMFRNSGAKCTLADGRQVTIDELAQIVQGKSPEQAFRENGQDFSNFRNFAP